MSRGTRLVLAIALVLPLGSAAFEFGRYKFPPQGRYRITIEQRGRITSAGQGAASRPVDQTFSASLLLVTGSEGPDGVPLVLTLEKADMQIARAGSKIPLSLPPEGPRRIEGILDPRGTVRWAGGTEPLAAFQARGVDILRILDFLPDLPPGDFHVGDRFDVAIPEGKARCSVKAREGDVVIIEARWSREVSDTTAGAIKKSVAGAKGELRYSLSDRVCRRVSSETTINTILGAAGNRPRQVVVTKAQLDIKVEVLR